MDPSINPSIKSAHVKLRVNILCKDTHLGFIPILTYQSIRTSLKIPIVTLKAHLTVTSGVKVDIMSGFIDVPTF